MKDNNELLLCCDNISKKYTEGNICTEVLININLKIKKSEMVAVVGGSGSGKSTLLHLLGGLDDPSNGDIFVKGHKINFLSLEKRAILRNRYIGFIYQFHHLLFDFSALENVAIPMIIGGSTYTAAYQESRNMLLAVGMEKRAHYRPNQLSGGERQRVAIARALINNPSIVLADEPTGNLDKYTTNNIFNLLTSINLNNKTTFLIVTHDYLLANRMNRIIKIINGRLYESKM